MFSFASEKRSTVLSFAQHAGALKNENTFIKTVNVEKGKGMPIVNIELKDHNFSDEASNKNLFNAIHIASGLMKQICNSTNGPSTIINNVMNNKKVIDVFKFVNTIEEVPPFLKIAAVRQQETPYLDRIIPFKINVDFSRQLRNTLFTNLENHENMHAIDGLPNCTFVYENFDYNMLIKQIEELQKSKEQYAFSMIISQDNSSHAVAVFSKNIESNIECILIGATKDTQELIKNISCFATEKNKFDLMIARFVVALYSSLVAQEKLKDLGLTSCFLYEKLGNQIVNKVERERELKERDEEIERLKKEADEWSNEKIGLLWNYKDVERLQNDHDKQIDALRPLIAKLKNEKAQLEKDKIQLNQQLTNNKAKWDTISSVFKQLFSKASGGFIFAVGLTYYLFIK